MAFGGATSSTTASVTLTGVTAGATILVWSFTTNGGGTVFAASDAQGSYATRGTIFTLGAGNTNSQALILTNANSGSHAITVTITGDTSFGTLAAWWTGVGDVDNSLAAHAEQGVTVAGSPPNNVTSGNCTTSTANTTVVGLCYFDNTGSLPAVGTSPNSFTSRFSATINALGTTLEDFAFSGTGSIAATFGGTAGNMALVQVLALAPAVSGPTINTQPSNATVYMGNAATFTVSATASAGSLTYQWKYSSGGAYSNCTLGSGITSASFTTANTVNAEAANGYNYECVVTDSNGNVTTNPAQLTVIGTGVTAWLT